jgi:hypothetical protein
MQHNSWFSVEDEIREQHRNDLLQVLAYGNLASTQRMIACLMFPCSVDLWKDLHQANQLIHKADVQAGTRSVQLWLTAIPMGLAPSEIGMPLEVALRSSVSAEVFSTVG